MGRRACRPWLLCLRGKLTNMAARLRPIAQRSTTFLKQSDAYLFAFIIAQDYEVTAMHSGVLMWVDEPSNATILWVPGLELTDNDEDGELM